MLQKEKNLKTLNDIKQQKKRMPWLWCAENSVRELIL